MEIHEDEVALKLWKVKGESGSHPVVSNSLRPHGL